MFNRTVIVLFVALSISWAQGSIRYISIYMNHKDHEPLYPNILDYDREYMEPQDDMRRLPAGYENLLSTLHDYVISPKDKYMEVLSQTSFTFGEPPRYDDSDKPYKFLKNSSVADIFKMPQKKSQFVETVIQAALNRLTESCEELEKTVNPLIINRKSTPRENDTGLNTEEKQLDLKKILLEVKTAKLVLQDLRNRMNFYVEDILDASHFAKKIGGLSLQGLLSYTDSAMRSVRGSWIDWKNMSTNFNVADTSAIGHL